MEQSRTVSVGDERLFCRRDGKDTEAPWLVFSNSLTTNLHLWDGQVASFGGDFRILRYDQRGHGASRVSSKPFGFSELAADVRALLDEFRIDRCTFIGLSMGVPTALRLIASAPERIERLVLCDGNAKSGGDAPKLWDERIALARKRGMEALADATIARWFSAASIAGGIAEPLRRMVAATPLEGFVGCANALRNYDCTDVPKKIAVPTLLVAGARDGTTPAAMRGMSEAITGASFVEVPNAGHIVNVENAAAFNHTLADFLAR